MRSVRESGQFYSGHRRIRASRTHARSRRCPGPSWFLAKSPAWIYDDATDSVECFISTIMRYELHG